MTPNTEHNTKTKERSDVHAALEYLEQRDWHVVKWCISQFADHMPRTVLEIVSARCGNNNSILAHSTATYMLPFAEAEGEWMRDVKARLDTLKGRAPQL